MNSISNYPSVESTLRAVIPGPMPDRDNRQIKLLTSNYFYVILNLIRPTPA
jgi:hypothetical protein